MAESGIIVFRGWVFFDSFFRFLNHLFDDFFRLLANLFEGRHGNSGGRAVRIASLQNDEGRVGGGLCGGFGAAHRGHFGHLPAALQLHVQFFEAAVPVRTGFDDDSVLRHDANTFGGRTTEECPNENPKILLEDDRCIKCRPFIVVRMRIGLIYDTFDAYPWRDDDPPDADAEYEPAETVDVLAETVRHMGHTPVRVGTAFDLRAQLDTGLDLDAAINIAEGAHSRNREAYAPILLEMAGIPCLGSDALTLSVTLDKAWTKDLVAAADVPTPPHRVFEDAHAIDPEALPAFPLFVKPRHEGTSKGITPQSRVESVDELREEVARVVATYEQDALVERFVEGGGEFTVAVVGHDPPEALPVLQRAVEDTTGIGLHALEHRGAPTADREWAYELTGTLDPSLEDQLQMLALRVFNTLDCRDFARADFRVDADGQPWFLEINPLPTFKPDDTFAISAEIQGRSYVPYLADVFETALRRLDLP